MCKSKMAINASEPDSGRRTPRTPRTPANQAPRTLRTSRPVSSASDPSASSSNTSGSYATTSSSYKLSSGTSSISSRTSLSSLRDTLAENPHIYDVSEIRDATNGFLAKRHHSSATPSWRCTLRGKDVIVFQRKFRRKIDTPQLRERLSVICRSHHGSIVKLHGASVSGDHIYLVYEFINGANLADCLRNSKNPNFTVLSTWISRMQIATDLAHGLDYIHNKTGLNINLVHNHIKSSSIMVTEPSFNAKICNFGTAQLCGEVDENEYTQSPKKIGGGGEITEVESDEDSSKLKELKRSDSGRMQFEGARGYMSPEYQSSGVATQKSDVYAFGVVILELLSGEEPFKYKFDKSKGAKGEFTRTSVIDTAGAAIDGGDDGGGIEGRMRKWVDRRLKDSFPVEVAEKIIRVALRCVHVDPDKRPDMGDVAGRISQQYMKSRIWSDNLRVPTNISVSLAPR